MKLRLLAAVLACISLVGPAFGDVPSPNPRPRPAPPAPLPPEPKVPTYPLVVESGPNVAEARLIIPRKMLGQMRGELEPQESDHSASVAGRARLHTIIAGSALALGLAFSGLWLVRRVNGKTLSLAVGTIVLFGVGAAVWADRAPARPIRPQPGNLTLVVNANMQSPRMDNVLVEVVDEGDSVKLIISKDKLTKSVYQTYTQPQNPAPRK